jgi:hypothetical protein
MDILLPLVTADLRRAGAISQGDEIIDLAGFVVDPAYVVFTADAQRTVREALEFLRRHGVEPLGRYGRWEYTSMAQVMQQGYTWAQSLPGALQAMGGR